MKLIPVSETSPPSYPSRARTLVSKTRKLAMIAGASAILASTGCASHRLPGQEMSAHDDPSPVVEPAVPAVDDEPVSSSAPARNVEYCLIELREAGERSMGQLFSCGAEPSPTETPTHEGPFWIGDGRACQGQTGWGRVQVNEPMRARLTLLANDILFEIRAPDGTPVARLEPGRDCVSLDMEPGLWTLAATHARGVERAETTFEFFFDRLDQP